MPSISTLSAQRFASTAATTARPRNAASHVPKPTGGWHGGRPQPASLLRHKRSMVPVQAALPGVGKRVYNGAVRTALATSYGLFALSSAAMRCVYKNRLMPPDTVALRDIRYTPDGTPPDAAQTLDVFSPPGKNLPVVLYIHGGAFVNGSKDTHWMMPLPFAHNDCVVVSINYRLAPRHPFPAALEDACTATQWVIDHIAEHRGDPSRLVLAGDSAGGNLVTGLAACMCWERPEPFAKALFDRGIAPRAVLPHAATYSMLKFDDYTAATTRDGRAARLLQHINNYYLREVGQRTGDYTLADPLALCATGTPPARPLPAFFISAGSRDPLVEDSLLASAALRGAGAEVDMRVYEGGFHVFHAMYFLPFSYRKIAQEHWMDSLRFLQRLGLIGPPRGPVSDGTTP